MNDLGMNDVSSQGLALLLDVSFRSLILAGAVALALRVWRVTDPALLHLAWRCVLLGMVAMPALCLWAPAMPVGTPASVTAWSQSLDQALEPLPARLATLVPAPPSLAAVPADRLADGPATTLFPEIRGGRMTAFDGWTWQSLLILLYGLGVAWMGARLLTGWWLTRRLVAAGEPLADVPWLRAPDEVLRLGRRRVDLVLHAGVRVPLATGWLRPCVLLPLSWQRWDEAKQRSILTHEWLHLRRGDYPVQLLAAVNRMLFWFHPLAWALPRRLASLAEHCCDAGVVRAHDNRQQYARYLLEVASSVASDSVGRSGRVAWLASAMTDGEGLSRRIRDVLAIRPGRAGHVLGRHVRRLAAPAVAVLALVTVAAAATVRLEAVEPTTESRSKLAATLEIRPAPSMPGAEARPVRTKVRSVSTAPETNPEPPTSVADRILGAPTDMAPIPVRETASSWARIDTPPAVRAEERGAAPRNFILFFDDESRQVTRRAPRGLQTGRVARAVREWIETELRPRDRVSVLSYKGHLRFHQDLTTDRGALARALEEVTRRKADSVDATAGEASLRRALPAPRELKKKTRQVVPALRLVGEAAAGIEGDKVLLLFTAGLSNQGSFDGRSSVAVSKSFYPRHIANLVAEMVASEVSVYTIFIAPPAFRGQAGGADLLAARTGGGYFFRHYARGVGPILRNIATSLEATDAAADAGVLQLSSLAGE